VEKIRKKTWFCGCSTDLVNRHFFLELNKFLALNKFIKNKTTLRSKANRRHNNTPPSDPLLSPLFIEMAQNTEKFACNYNPNQDMIARPEFLMTKAVAARSKVTRNPIQDAKASGVFDQIPAELLDLIIQHLSVVDRLAFRLTCYHIKETVRRAPLECLDLTRFWIQPYAKKYNKPKFNRSFKLFIANVFSNIRSIKENNESLSNILKFIGEKNNTVYLECCEIYGYSESSSDKVFDILPSLYPHIGDIYVSYIEIDLTFARSRRRRCVFPKLSRIVYHDFPICMRRNLEYLVNVIRDPLIFPALSRIDVVLTTDLEDILHRVENMGSKKRAGGTSNAKQSCGCRTADDGGGATESASAPPPPPPPIECYFNGVRATRCWCNKHEKFVDFFYIDAPPVETSDDAYLL
jgi:hypothetical protein